MYRRHPQITLPTTPSSKTQVIVLSMDCRILHVTGGTGALAHLLSKGGGPILSHTPRSPLPHPLLDVFHCSWPLLRSASLRKTGIPSKLSPAPTRWTVPCGSEDSAFPIWLGANNRAWSSPFTLPFPAV
jgi:hypothetical protein